MNFKTKPRGEQASFRTDCVACGGELTVSNGRIDPHTCDFRARNLEAIREQIDNPLTFADLDAAFNNR
jgi:hypothetical protein